MNEDNNTSDKITIKVRHSDEDYHDITIDWSNESFDYRQQLHHQLSAYTGIPVEYQLCILVENPDPLRCLDLRNAKFIDEARRIIGSWDTKEFTMVNIHDGDCFLFQTQMISFCDYPSIYCAHILYHLGRADENGCNLDYCHYLGSRFFTQKFSKLIKSEHLQTLLDRRVEGQTWEALRKMQLNLNISHLTRLECSAVLQEHPYLIPGPEYYLRYRG